MLRMLVNNQFHHMPQQDRFAEMLIDEEFDRFTDEEMPHGLEADDFSNFF